MTSNQPPSSKYYSFLPPQFTRVLPCVIAGNRCDLSMFPLICYDWRRLFLGLGDRHEQSRTMCM